MRILLNFLSLKGGGGAQVGLDFIEQAKAHGGNHQWFLVSTEGTPFENVALANNFHLAETVPNNLFSRTWFEYVGCRSVIHRVRPDLVYTQFGGHWPGAHIPHVTGCALPYLAYPEAVRLWDDESILKRLRLRLHIAYMKRRLRASQKIVFETQVMADRISRNLDLDPVKVCVVRPACSSLVNANRTHPQTAERCRDIPQGFRIVFVSTYYPHKNFFVIPRIAECLKTFHQIEDVRFLLTLPYDHPATTALLKEAHERGVESMIFNVGPIPPEGCGELYRAADVVILPSRIESFSNTMAEAWSMQKPLLVSDVDWAREACADSAFFFDCDDANDAAARIMELKESEALRTEMIHAGTCRLNSFPNPEQRFKEYLTLLEGHAADCQ